MRARLPVTGAARYVRPVRLPGRARPVERPEDAGLQRPVGDAARFRVHHHGQAEDIGQQNVLVPCLVADVAAPLQEVGGGQQLPRLEPDLPGEVVRVPDHGGQDLPGPGAAGTG